MTWAEVWHEREWDADSKVEILLYFDKSRTRWSKKYSLDTYTQMYSGLTGSDRVFDSLTVVVDLALVEWQQAVT